MKRIVFQILISIVVVSGIRAQNIEFKSSNFKDNKDGLKAAVENIKLGDEFLASGVEALKAQTDPKMSFINALEQFDKAQQFNPDNAELNYKIGKCLLQTPDKLSAEKYLVKAIELDENVNPEVYFLLGQVYKLNYKFDEAKYQFKQYKSRLKDKEYDEIKHELQKQIKECESAIELIKTPIRVWVDNVKGVNTKYPDYCAAISADEYTMIFNSKRPETTGGKTADDGYYYSDIYVSYRNKRSWTKPTGIGAPLNSDGQDECLAISPDGQKIYVYKNEGNGDIYLSVLEGENWSSPEKLSEIKVNSENNETHASFNYNEREIYLVSDQPYNNVGGKDIFFSGKDFRGDWGKRQTVGRQVINTKYDEGSVFMHPDGETIYFSSKGHNSMGGYDIFMVRRIPGGWSQPVNLGYPINTPFDETFFVMSANGKHAYITSNREGDGVGDMDIYRITFLGPLKPMTIDNEDHLLASFAEPIQEATLAGAVNIESKSLTILKGRVLDDFTSKPIKAEIEIVDNDKNTVIATFTSNSKTGKFLVSLPAGINYGIAVKAKDYLFHSENFNLPKTSDYQLVEKDIRLKNVCIGCKIILRNIFFDTGKSTIRDESTTELNRLVTLIKDIERVKPGIKIEISGHTDNVGSANTNQRLSESRAKSVVNYLIQHGVNASKLVYKGYGETQPVASNNTSAGKQANRRTEFKILEN